MFTHADVSYSRELLTPTTVAGVKRSSASVCLSVCPHDKTTTAEIAITKLATGIVHASEVMATHLILGQKAIAKAITKCKNIFQLKAIEWPA